MASRRQGSHHPVRLSGDRAASAKELLPIVLDKTTTSADAELPGRINVNTAPQAVLSTLPGLEQQDIDSIMSKQPGPTRRVRPIRSIRRPHGYTPSAT